MREYCMGLAVICFALAAGGAAANSSFTNFETPHVHPLDLSPDGTTLAACNTPDGRVDIYDVSGGTPVLDTTIQVGLNPVTVRFQSNTILWVVNMISDSVSIVDLTTGLVIETIETEDEPADVVFAGSSPAKAFVSCSQPNIIQVFNASTFALITEIDLIGDDPRAMATNAAGTEVYVAVFESGNHTTILAGGLIEGAGGNPIPSNVPNVVDDLDGPHGGVNPPPNDGAGFDPPQSADGMNPPEVGLIVRKDTATGMWLDDTGADWSAKVDGLDANDSGRVTGWDVADNDVAIIDANTFAVEYAQELMNIVMAIGTDNAGNVSVVGIESLNEIRFEPKITGTFIRVRHAQFDPGDPPQPNDTPPNAGAFTITDLNKAHLDSARGGADTAYDPIDFNSPVPQSERDKSIGDPRGIVWLSSGKGYITGMGSNNVVPMASATARTALGATIEVPEGPTGIVASNDESKVYVMSKFAAAISTIDTTTDTVIDTVNFFDPTPDAIKIGRKHLYDTHKNSGLGHISCASCHIDGTMDGLAWDLGAPNGSEVDSSRENLGFGMGMGPFDDFHPMKGPMTTQTMRDIIGKEPFHWRGDRRGLLEFAEAFKVLQGDDEALPLDEINEFKAFLATVHFPPNPFRDLDNTLPDAAIPLPHQFATGDHGLPRGTPMPDGDPQRGLRLYMGLEPPNEHLDGEFNCSTCHTLPLGNGPDSFFNGTDFEQIPADPGTGNRHSGLTGNDGSTNRSIKVPHLRNGYLKIGFDTSHDASTSISLKGFGYLHDGSIDSLTEFLDAPVFDMRSDQDVADMVALMLCFSGSDFDALGVEAGIGAVSDPANQNPTDTFPSDPPSFFESKDAHAAVGKQVTIDSSSPSAGDLDLINELIAMADAGAIDLIVKGAKDGAIRGWFRKDDFNKFANTFQSDVNGVFNTLNQLLALAGSGTELTFTAVPEGAGQRMGVDRDEDGAFDFFEIQAGTDPNDPNSGGLPFPVRMPWILVLAVLCMSAAAYSLLRTRRTPN